MEEWNAGAAIKLQGVYNVWLVTTEMAGLSVRECAKVGSVQATCDKTQHNTLSSSVFLNQFPCIYTTLWKHLV